MKNDALHTEEYQGYRIEIFADEDAMNPREECDNLCTMACWHRRYSLGDEQPRDNPVEHMRELIRIEDDGKFDRSIDEGDENETPVQDLILAEFDRLFFHKPLYLYDHGAITISTGPFSCPWDSGQVGFIYLSKYKAEQEYKGFLKDTTLEQAVYSAMDAEVNTYDQYLTGDVYGYVIPGDDVDPMEDSCWGFFGFDYCLQEARATVDYRVRRRAEESAKQMVGSLCDHPRALNLWGGKL